ncbi:MAG: hypothetical protein A3J06_03980 [Candidatus Moranbacteria bacterium RIFCSPLOWO2_02_FULL_48_19]|nr:MAG: hypothetical protein A3J06_03980 [Candidatus Moranbacteria bacterium RIFCSPLOWO2_02_FULL_48_19]
MENQLTKLDKAVKISIIVGALIVALSVAYYLVIFLPQKEKVRVEQQKQEQQQVQQAKDDAVKRDEKEKSDNKKSLTSCLFAADIGYTNNWDKACKKLGGGVNCGLPAEQADGLDRHKKNEQDNCFKRYPQ